MCSTYQYSASKRLYGTRTAQNCLQCLPCFQCLPCLHCLHCLRLLALLRLLAPLGLLHAHTMTMTATAMTALVVFSDAVYLGVKRVNTSAVR